jgi:TRAP-type C4-dicarboxylate transport system substrate-binding protein
MKAKGLQINPVPAAEIAKLREKVKPVVDKFSKQIGEPFVAEVNAEIAKVRK